MRNIRGGLNYGSKYDNKYFRIKYICLKQNNNNWKVIKQNMTKNYSYFKLKFFAFYFEIRLIYNMAF